MNNKKIKLHRFDRYFFIKDSVTKYIKDDEIHVTHMYCLNQSFDLVQVRNLQVGSYYLVNDITFVVKQKLVLNKQGNLKNMFFNLMTPIDTEEGYLILKDVTFSFNKDFIKLLSKKYLTYVLRKV